MIRKRELGIRESENRKQRNGISDINKKGARHSGIFIHKLKGMNKNIRNLLDLMLLDTEQNSPFIKLWTNFPA